MAARIPVYIDFRNGEIVQFDSGDTINPTYATNVGGSGSANVGEAEVLMGESPSAEATVAITGQTSILSTSKCMAWIQGATTASNNETDHLFGGVSFKITCGIPTAGTGFTIYVTSTAGLCDGYFKIQWQWI